MGGTVGRRHGEAVGNWIAGGRQSLHRGTAVVERVGPFTSSAQAKAAVAFAADRAHGHCREGIGRAVHIGAVQLATGRGDAKGPVQDAPGFSDPARAVACDHSGIVDRRHIHRDSCGLGLQAAVCGDVAEAGFAVEVGRWGEDDLPVLEHHLTTGLRLHRLDGQNKV